MLGSRYCILPLYDIHQNVIFLGELDEIITKFYAITPKNEEKGKTKNVILMTWRSCIHFNLLMRKLWRLHLSIGSVGLRRRDKIISLQHIYSHIVRTSRNN